ncbi:flagellar basal body rod protein FlgB [Virgibacillus byunsanensis]|uniref:Flagellar basal body rod protein FlgB n=1 Tax=Virgibacillus byunsanensis TaxID=570945 RepID=A0ABW3LJI8_9BACI
MNLFSGTINTLENSLDYASAKNRTISNNIANVDTPNYKSKSVDFKNVLRDELSSTHQTKRTHPKHIAFGTENNNTPFQISTDNNTIYNHNGNNVDIDKEMSELAKNQIYYQGLVDRINGKLGSLQTVIRGGN